MITTRLDPEIGGLGQNIILCQHISAITVCYCSKMFILQSIWLSSLWLPQVFLQYDMIGYYLFVCMIYVVVIFFRLAGSLLFYSIDDLILNYVIYNCLLRVIYVIWLAIHSRLCRGAYAVVLWYHYTWLFIMFTFRIDIAYTYVVSYWPSRDVKVITY